jgi:SAM-dependent methyltransferase
MGDTSDSTSPTARCAACGHENPWEKLFCSRCTAPLAVAGLHELDQTDFAACAAALLDLVADISRESASGDSRAVADESLWNAYLSAWWLRPETALVLYGEALAIAAAKLSLGLQDSLRPHIDLGCGDGIHSAIVAGWRFDPSFDAFQSLDLTAKDVYHHFDSRRFSRTISAPGKTIDFGIDIKPTAIARAHALGVFQQVLQADATRLPLRDASIGTIFSNMLRDLGDPLPPALAECRRVLRDDGRLLLSAMTPAYASSLYFAPAAREADGRGDADRAAALLRLDRGRSVFCQRQLSDEQWNEVLSPVGLVVETAIPIVSAAVMRFWDVGLRPFTSTLLGWREQWQRTGQLQDVKTQALAFLRRLLDPLAEKLNDGSPAMHLLVIRKL